MHSLLLLRAGSARADLGKGCIRCVLPVAHQVLKGQNFERAKRLRLKQDQLQNRIVMKHWNRILAMAGTAVVLSMMPVSAQQERPERPGRGNFDPEQMRA